MSKSVYALITTDHTKRGVFMAKVLKADLEALATSKEETLSIKASEIQMCVCWDAATKGVLGLASKGPGPGCRVSAPTPASFGIITGVTFVCECSKEAIKAWKLEPWSK